MTQAPASVRELVRQSLLLAQILADAEDAQWEPSPTPKPRDDTTERAKGGHGDPTLAITLDDRRLALRASVSTASAEIIRATTAISAARANVHSALARWNGDES